jgi:hypothetical protein
VRLYQVTLGHGKDVCPNCRIFRKYAGYARESCGQHFNRPGCFVIGSAEATVTTTTASQSSPKETS